MPHGRIYVWQIGGKGGRGPAWARGEIEAPAGIKDMGTWQAAVYTAEQQKRLGVTETGEAAPQACATHPPMCSNALAHTGTHRCVHAHAHTLMRT